jgi:tetratricopeptide (TPR) repeat protein
MNTTTSFKGNSSEIIERLFCNDYRIIHLSGHGIFNQDQTKGSGMVIGKDMYLSTREIKQMSTVPELVFVNCCHIGKVDGLAEELYQQRYKLAANIGTQLIENGVRCVIAAGWAIDDNAALEFAGVFYDRMFEGYTFGESVKDARRSVLEKHGNTNTWGAYQCYGDPFFRFEHLHLERKKHKIEYLITQEAEVDLENLLSELQIGKKSTDEYLKILDSISIAVDQAKIRTHSITEKEALVYFELREYNKACDKLGSLLNKEEASFSFSVAEKYYNALAKKIAIDFKLIFERKTEELKIIEVKIKELSGDEINIEELKILEKKKEDFVTMIIKERNESVTKIDKVIEDLEALVKLIPSSERFNILGSTYKRRAYISETDKQIDYIKAASKYQKANAFSGNWYSLTNWLALESVLVLSGLHKWETNVVNSKSEFEYKLPTLSEVIRLLDISEESLCKNSERMSYWDMLAGINIGFCKYILQFTEKNDKNQFEIIQKEIGKLWKKAGSKGKRFAEIEHLEFIIDALSIKENRKTTELKAKLEQLKKDLDRWIEV